MTRILIIVATVVVFLALVVSCSGLSKDEVRSTLLELEKNAPVRELGLEQRTFTFPVDGRSEGTATYYHVRGAGDGAPTPVVLVHGTPSSLMSWTEVVFGDDGLARDHDVYVVDVVGHGTTRTTLDDYTFAACAEWIAAFIADLDVGPVDLVGQSYGGEFAWRTAVEHPELVRRLVLMNSSGVPRKDDEWLPEEKAMRNVPGASFGYLLNSPARIETALEPHFPEELDPERVREVWAVADNPDNWGAMVDLARDENGERVEDLARIAARTLLLWGGEDIAYPVERFAREFERRIPDCRLDVMADTFHYPQEQRPAETARRLRAFFAEP